MQALLVIIVIFIILLLLLIGLNYFIKGFSFIYSKNKIVFFLFLGAVITLPYLVFKQKEETFYLEHIPQEMGVSKILYKKTESWGFGPGGNETGVVVFELPENSAQTIESGGTDFFNVISKDDTPRNEYIRKCGDWQESPLSDAKTSWTLGRFLNQYGFGVTVDQAIENEINLAASTKGSYSAGCAGGAVIIVSPKIKKVFFLYAG